MRAENICLRILMTIITHDTIISNYLYNHDDESYDTEYY